MKILNLNQFNEKIKANQISLSDLKDVDVDFYNYHPKTKDELKQIIEERIKQEGPECDLNDIDVSNITNMYGIFKESKFDGDISKWNVSEVTDMHWMFYRSNFNGDISKWNVSKVTDMRYMFYCSKKFNGDISKWDVRNVTDMSFMFDDSKFDGDISEWDVSNVTDMSYMFDKCPLKTNPPAWYKNN